MAFQTFKNIRISGIAACIPKKIEENSTLSLFQSSAEYERFVATTGIERRHVVENGVCSSDLCYEAAEKLIEKLKWVKDEIDCLVFVSQTPDYILPATACVLQQRLNLPNECMSFDISMGCSGWVYGITVLSSLLSNGICKKGLLLVGDTVTVTKSPKDKTTYPLFGDAGTATALEFQKGANGIVSYLCTDGGGADTIMIRDGGFRHPFTAESLRYKEYENGSIRNNLQSYLDGTSVFTFGISKAPKSVKKVLDFVGKSLEDIDYFIFHQANMLMNEKIRTKLKIPAEKVPYILRDFGNTSSTSIPLTLVAKLKEQLINNNLQIMTCGFGVGLSWGSVLFQADHVVCCDIIEF
jgi:3-oxoacyl-[acyl-carrier-protein] synthase-3